MRDSLSGVSFFEITSNLRFTQSGRNGGLNQQRTMTKIPSNITFLMKF